MRRRRVPLGWDIIALIFLTTFTIGFATAFLTGLLR